MKHTPDYDSTFKTLKVRHARLFISVINEAFQKSYPINSRVEILPSEGYFVNASKEEQKNAIEKRESDFLLRIEDDYYLLECQTYDDDSMALRLAEYTFLAARGAASFDQAHVILPLPHFTVVYIKNTEKTPRTTTITYQYPDGTAYDYTTDNIFLSDLTREEIIEKQLYVYIPFYIARYEKELQTETNYRKAIEDLEFFRDHLMQLRKDSKLDDSEIFDIRTCVNQIVSHITDGNTIEKEMVSVMGGEIFELPSEKLIRETTERVTAEVTAQVTAEFSQKLNRKDQQISEQMQKIADLEAQIKAMQNK